MFNPMVSRSVLEARYLLFTLPPHFLLPIRRSRSFNSSAPIIEGDGAATTTPDAILHSTSSSSTSNSSAQSTAPSSAAAVVAATALLRSSKSSLPPTAPGRPDPLAHESLRQLLPLLKAQRSHYITVHIHARPYLLTVGDTVRLPFHMTDVVPGDIIRLNRASIIGSRDYTLKGAPHLDENLFECRARVMAVDSEPMRTILRTKPRQRKVKRIKSKHKYTVLKLAELIIKDLP